MKAKHANTRTKGQIERDRIEVARLYLQGKYQHEIASVLGVSQQQVSFDLRAVQAQWREMPAAQIDELKNKELARIDELERVYWEAWQKSQLPKEITNTAKDGDRLRVGKRSEQRNGNAQYLAGVQWCIERRIKLLGLDAPVKSELTAGVSVTVDKRHKDYEQMDIDELTVIYQEGLKRGEPGFN